MSKKTTAPAGPKEVTVQWANVWTSEGKKLQGEKVKLPADEIKALGEAVK